MSAPFRPTSPATDLATLRAALPSDALYGQGDDIGWTLSPEPYTLTATQAQQITELGNALWAWSKALDTLYRDCLKDPKLAWLKTVFHNGKPEPLLTYGQMKRFRQAVPFVVRPDLLVTESGFALCEVDAVPGGLGFTGALSQAYRQSGWPDVPALDAAFWQMLCAQFPQPDGQPPQVAVVISDEAADYRSELTWLCAQLSSTQNATINAVHPKQLRLRDDQLGWVDDAGVWTAIQVIYRFFELFDLPNIPNIELIQFAVKKGQVACTPPFKPHLEEKLAMALFHHPALQPFWDRQLSDAHRAALHAVIPTTWILDPVPVPAHAAVLPSLRVGGRTLPNFDALGDLSQKERELVLKPSGFSPLAWGSRGVVIGHDMPQTDWQGRVSEALAAFHTTPHILQPFVSARVELYRWFSPDGSVQQGEGRTRVCPYFFANPDGNGVTWAGTLATTCPKDKKRIHGMRDGILRPAVSP